MNILENSPEKGHKKDREVGSCDIRGEAEIAVIYFSEQKNWVNWVNLTFVYESLLGGNKEGGAKIFPEVANERTSDNGSKGDFELWVCICSFHCYSGRTLAKIGQRDHGVSILQRIKSLTI